MKTCLLTGWTWCKNHIYIWTILFLYQLLWGFFIYRFVDQLVTPILHRYPYPAPTTLSTGMFITESQFQLTKTNEYIFYLWCFIGFIAIHMLLTPFFLAGLLYTLSHPTQHCMAFFRGMKATWKPVMLLYLLETILCLAPAYWFIPYATQQFSNFTSLSVFTNALIPIIISWLIGAWLLHQLFLILQFGVTASFSLIHSIKAGCSCLFSLMGLSLFSIVLTVIASALSISLSLTFTGITALIMQQAFPAIHIALKIWCLAARHAAWQKAT